MKVLLVEDDVPKREAIYSLITGRYPAIPIDIATSVSSASRKIESGDYDLVVLDMSLPNFDFDKDPTGGRPVNYGGEDVIDYIDSLGKHTKVIFISQYAKFKEEFEEKGLNELANELKDNYPDYYLGMIYYHTAIDTWRKELTNIIDGIIDDLA